MSRIFSARRQAAKLVAVMVGVWIFLVPLVLLGWDEYQHYGLDPADGGVLKPYVERLAWLLVPTLLGTSVAVALLVYGRRYVLSIDLDDERGTLSLRTLWFVIPTVTTVPLSDLRGTRSHGGRTPFLTMRVKGRRIPFVVDLQGDFPDSTLFTLVDRAAAARPEPDAGDEGNVGIADHAGRHAAAALAELTHHGKHAGSVRAPDSSRPGREPEPADPPPPAPLRTRIYVLVWFVAMGAMISVGSYLLLADSTSPGQEARARWFGIAGRITADSCQQVPYPRGPILECTGRFVSLDGAVTLDHLALRNPWVSDYGHPVPAWITGRSASIAFTRPEWGTWAGTVFADSLGIVPPGVIMWKCRWPIQEARARVRRRRRGQVSS